MNQANNSNVYKRSRQNKNKHRNKIIPWAPTRTARKLYKKIPHQNQFRVKRYFHNKFPFLQTLINHEPSFGCKVRGNKFVLMTVLSFSPSNWIVSIIASTELRSTNSFRARVQRPIVSWATPNPINCSQFVIKIPVEMKSSQQVNCHVFRLHESTRGRSSNDDAEANERETWWITLWRVYQRKNKEK